MEDVTDALDQLARAIRICARCPLHKSRRHAVPGEGDAALPVVFVGAAPGYDEDRLARLNMSCGPRLLVDLLRDAGIERSDVRWETLVR